MTKIKINESAVVEIDSRVIEAEGTTVRLYKLADGSEFYSSKDFKKNDVISVYICRSQKFGLYLSYECS